MYLTFVGWKRKMKRKYDEFDSLPSGEKKIAKNKHIVEDEEKDAAICYINTYIPNVMLCLMFVYCVAYTFNLISPNILTRVRTMYCMVSEVH